MAKTITWEKSCRTFHGGFLGFKDMEGIDRYIRPYVTDLEALKKRLKEIKKK